MKLFICFIFIVLAGTWAGCAGHEQPPAMKAGNIVTIDTANASCAYLASDNKGNIVLSWVRQINDSTAALCYAISADKGQSFSHPVVIPHTAHVQPHGENIPKLVFKPSGEIIAIWGEANANARNKYSGLVFYTQSFDGGKSWANAKPLVTDTASYDQRYFDVAVLKTGEAAVIWLDNRKQTPAEGSTLYFATTHGKSGFIQERPIGESVCQCCRTDLLVDEAGAMHVLYRDIISDSIRDMVHTVSTDGKTFSPAKPISKDNWVIRGCPHSGPAMVTNKTGLHFAWFTGGNAKGIFYCHSTDNGASFSVRDSVRQSAAAKHPQIASWGNGNMLITWDEGLVQHNQAASLIGVCERNDAGPVGKPLFISDAAKRSSFPAVQIIDDKTALIAYTQSGERQPDHVVYQLLSVQ
jgi:hypothetical protein